jgi:hypothetical protein
MPQRRGMRTPMPLPGPLRGRAFTVDAAIEQGVSVRRLRAGDLATPFRGIRAPAHAETRLDTCRAFALRMRGHEAFSHATAAELGGLPLPRRLTDERRIHVTTWNGTQPPRCAGVVGHRSVEPPPLRRHAQLRLIAPADAWCQLASVLAERELIVAATDSSAFRGRWPPRQRSTPRSRGTEESSSRTGGSSTLRARRARGARGPRASARPARRTRGRVPARPASPPIRRAPGRRRG